jgi:hypothetical protein
VPSAENKEYIEDFDNRAIGLEYTTAGQTGNWIASYVAVYVNKNSNGKESLYLAAMREYRTDNQIKFGTGVIAATGGYDVKLVMSPVATIGYKWLRLVSSYPIAQVFGAPSDVINIQLRIPL